MNKIDEIDSIDAILWSPIEDSKKKTNIDRAFDSLSWYIDMIKKYWRLWDKTPWEWWDNILKWFIRWKVYTIGAYSNVGKSKFSYNIVNHVIWLWKKVCFFSLEVDSWMVLQNLICNRMKIKAYDIDNLAAIREIIGKSYDKLEIYDNVYKLETMEEVVKDTKPDYVFIDFVQNIQISWGSKYEKMADIAIRIQQMAISNKATVFSLSQLSNSVGKDVSRWDSDFVSLKWAWELFASSDVIFLLSREYELLKLEIVKNKYWRVKDIFYFTPERETASFTLSKPPY